MKSTLDIVNITPATSRSLNEDVDFIFSLLQACSHKTRHLTSLALKKFGLSGFFFLEKKFFSCCSYLFFSYFCGMKNSIINIVNNALATSRSLNGIEFFIFFSLQAYLHKNLAVVVPVTDRDSSPMRVEPADLTPCKSAGSFLLYNKEVYAL